MNIEKIFESRKDKPILNTSYPLSPEDWAKWRVRRALSFADDKKLAFYLHIPFCERLCSFCEYTKTICRDEVVQRQCVMALGRDVDNFVKTHSDFRLTGFDIGGGTPTALTEDNFQLLMWLFKSTVAKVVVDDDFEPSVEATFETLTPAKVEMIEGAGIRRVSLGIQSVNAEVLALNNRHNVGATEMRDTIWCLHAHGVCRVNVDLMYGLKGQSLACVNQDLRLIEYLNPEQVTLYELRTNSIRESANFSHKILFDTYSLLYYGLVKLGYSARFGQNTFSKEDSCMGVSSYLRHRMLFGGSYKGFGISAQSMSTEGVAYNQGKLSANIGSLLKQDTIKEEYTYVLPPAERAAKYIAISAYCGFFSLDVLTNMLGRDAAAFYSDQLDFCLSRRYVEVSDGMVHVTPVGFEHYGAVFSLFYSPMSP